MDERSLAGCVAGTLAGSFDAVRAGFAEREGVVGAKLVDDAGFCAPCGYELAVGDGLLV